MSSSGHPPPPLHPVHAGPADSWHGIIKSPSSSSSSSSHSPFPPARDRYHLYIGLFCPFAHRVNLVRHLVPGLRDLLPLSVVRPFPKGDDKGWPGWQFPQERSRRRRCRQGGGHDDDDDVAPGEERKTDGEEEAVVTTETHTEGEEENDDDEEEDEGAYAGATRDRLFGSKYLHEVYFRADPGYQGRYSVPVLWDVEGDTMVCNESMEMLRWLPTAFDDILFPSPSFPPSAAATTTTQTSTQTARRRESPFYPPPLRPSIDAVTPWLVRDLCAGVYRAGFAPDQASYDAAVPRVFAALNRLELLLHQNGSGNGFILGGGGGDGGEGGRGMEEEKEEGKETTTTTTGPTELDILAYVTVVRFDAIYVQHFKCNLGTIRGDYPIVHAWLRNLYWNVPGFRETTDFRHIRENYTKSHPRINPLAITPMGPFPDVVAWEPGRDHLDFAAMTPGAVRHPAVLAYQETLPGLPLGPLPGA